MYLPPSVKPLCPPEIPPKYEDVVYADVLLDNGEPYQLKLDIYQDAQQTEPGPCILYIFGGGFLWGEYKQTTQKAVYCRDLVRLTKQGFTVVCPDYRLATQAIFPACIHDIKGVVRFLKAHAEEFHIDSDRIGVLGNSAGGYLANMLALTADVAELEGTVGGNLEYSSQVKIAAVFYGISDLCEVLRDTLKNRESKTDLTGTEIESQVDDQSQAIPAIIVGYNRPEKTVVDLAMVLECQDRSHPDWNYIEQLETYSPIRYVHSETPPLLLLHGAKDKVVPLSQSLTFYQELASLGADVTFLSYGQGTHGPSLGEDVDQFAYDFLMKRL